MHTYTKFFFSTSWVSLLAGRAIPQLKKSSPQEVSVVLKKVSFFIVFTMIFVAHLFYILMNLEYEGVE